MGQYYNIITRNSNKTTVYDRSIKGDGDYVMAKLLGYDIHQVAGKVDLPHSWTVIKQNGREWVYDPNFTNETGRNGWKIYYGKRGTWRYNHYYKMN